MSISAPSVSNRGSADGGTGRMHAKQLLTLSIGDERYGLEISQIREILGVPKISKVPQSAGYFKGVIDLRGTVIPVVDLRLRLGMSERAHDSRTCIIVVSVGEEGSKVSIGIVVDSVNDVIKVNAEEIQATPHYGSSVDTSSVVGVIQVQEHVIITLDVNKMFEASDKVFLFARECQE